LLRMHISHSRPISMLRTSHRRSFFFRRSIRECPLLVQSRCGCLTDDQKCHAMRAGMSGGDSASLSFPILRTRKALALGIKKGVPGSALPLAAHTQVLGRSNKFSRGHRDGSNKRCAFQCNERARVHPNRTKNIGRGCLLAPASARPSSPKPSPKLQRRRRPQTKTKSWFRRR
jgi:hypothetical protein